MFKGKMGVSKAIFIAGLIVAILASSLIPIMIVESGLINGSRRDKGSKGDTGATAITDRSIVVISPGGNPVSDIDVQCLDESGDNTSGFPVTSGDGCLLFNTTIRNGNYALQPYDPTGCGVDLDQFRYWSQSALDTQYLALVVASGSMCTLPGPYCDGWSHPFYPTLHVGDLVIVQRANADEIRAAPYPDGDVIAFQLLYGDELVVHRAIEKRMDPSGNISFVTKGDGNPAPDQPIPASHVVGKVILRIPWIGHIVLLYDRLFSKMFS